MSVKKDRIRRVLAILLIIAMTMPALRLPAIAAGTYEDYLGGWKVDCVWSDLTYDYRWDSATDTVRRPKLIFTYRIENADRGYAPGSIRMEIPGIGNSYRKGIKEAYCLPTDSGDSEWDVSWDQNADIYTFTNLFDVEAGQSVSGGFEIIWELESRDIQSGYSQQRSPRFSVSQKGSITLRPLGFSFTSLRDRYRLELSRGSLNSSMSAKADPDHIWYGFTATFAKDWLSRGLYLSACTISLEVPSGTDTTGMAVIDENGRELPSAEQADGLLAFDLFEGRSGDLGNDRKILTKDFMVGVPRGLMDGEKMTVHVHLDRLYNDEDEWVRTAGRNETVDQEMTLTVDEYEFSYQGLVYATDLWNDAYEDYNKPPDYYRYDYEDELSHQAPPEYEERLNAADLYAGKVVEFTLRGSAKRDYGGNVKTMNIFASPSDMASASDALHMPDDAMNEMSASENSEKDNGTEVSSRGDIVAGSSIGEKDEYSMVLGDDVLAVFLNDGSMRTLEDDEYDLAYVTLPENTYGCTYNIYTAGSADIPFDGYELMDMTDNARSGTYALPDGVKAVFVRIDGISGNLDTSIRVGVRFHFDWKEEQSKDLPERIDSENRLVNFSFFRALSGDDKNGGHNDCEVTGSFYGGVFGENLADRDKELYGEWLLRDYSNVWLRSAVMSLKAGISIDSLEPEADKYTSQVSVNGTIRSDNEGDLSRFSLYTVLPDGLRADFDSGRFIISGSLTKKNGEPVDHPEDYVSFSEGTYNGRSMIIADFDFSRDPLMADASNRVRIYYPVKLSRADQPMYGDSYTVSVYLLVHDEGIGNITGSAITADEYDIDGNGDTSEKMAFASARAYIEMSADEWRESVSKYVKSAYSQGYEADAVTTFTALFYEYRLDFGMGSSGASDIVFFDRLEQGAVIAVNESEGSYEKKASEWQGEFCLVDTSYAESKGLRPTVYYSTNADEAFDLASPGWSTACPEDRSEVRSIAVAMDTRDLPEDVMGPEGYIYVLVKMRAPDNEQFIGRTAVNQYTVSYLSQGAASASTGAPPERHTLPSGATSLKLMDSVGKITLQKVDADNVIRVDADGIPHYAALTGGTFQIRDDKGQPLFESPQSLDPLGRIVVNNVEPGTYYWEEITAPEGYERIPGRHPFTVEGFGEAVTMENHRLPGSVNLKKHDQNDAGLKLLSGAVYELTMGNGEKVFTDEDYHYAQDGKNSSFITGEDGTFTVTGLPWGNYEFTEVTAPAGYELSARPLSFSIGKSSYDEESGSIEVTIDAYDTQKTATIRLEKHDSTSGSPVAGAVYSLYRTGEEGDDDECVASGLKTGREGEIEVGGLRFGTYYFAETQNAGGYLLPYPDERRTDTVTLDAGTAGEVITVSHEDDRMKGSVRLHKCDDIGRPVAGAAFDLWKITEAGEDQRIGSCFTKPDTDEESYGEIYVDDLEWGDYYFKETMAPEGYELMSDEIPFTIDRESAQNTIELEVVNERLRGSVKIIKADRSDPGKLLPGARFTLYFASGEPCVAGTDYTLPDGADSIITGDDGSIILSGLKQGAYFLKEMTAPDSYSLNAETIRFSVTMENAELLQELRVEDDRGMAVLTIDKEVNDVCEAFGDPTFIFKVTRSDGKRYYTSLTLAPSVFTGSVSLNVEQGYTYTVEEVPVSRYEPDRVEALVNAEADAEGNTAVADLVTNDNAEVKFCNVIEQYEKFSHSANVVNSIKKSARLTAVTVAYTGPDPITAGLPGFDKEQEIYLIPHDDLEVRAFFDDGTSETVKSGDYTLMPAYADGNSDSYTGTVSVFRDGVQRSASFSVALALPVPDPRSLVTYELNGGMIIPPGESSAVETYRIRVKTGNTLTRPVNDPVRENFRFEGWFLDKDLKTPAEFPLTVAGDMRIYAGWEHEPVNVRYAVALYGIETDKDGSGQTSGLTFGPALGTSYINNARFHVPGEGQRCLHNMTWDEIIRESRANPAVFEECLENGCTHAVDLTIRGELAENVTPVPQTSGDGASVIFDSIDEALLRWAAEPEGEISYSGSDIQKLLNGGLEGVRYSLADALPDELRTAIQKKNAVNDDTIWLFSLSELFPEDKLPSDTGVSKTEGNLYERQRIVGSSDGQLTGYSEDGRPKGFWLRTSSSSQKVYAVTDEGIYSEEPAGSANGIAFGFCLPGPAPHTRVAVSLYGICHDTYMDGNGTEAPAGLTFGPPLNEDYRESYVSHAPSGKTKAGNRHRCIHDDDWDTIASWSVKDPYVYEDCLGGKDTPGCTKGIDIFLNDRLAGKRFSFTGDGSGMLYEAVDKNRRSFSYPYDIDDYAVNDGGWPASYIRAVLNGADMYTNKLCDGSDAIVPDTGSPIAGEDPPREEESLFNCLPSRLRAHIVPKAVISDTWYDDQGTTGHTVTTFDRLWLFSAHELWAEGELSEIHPNEGAIYEKQAMKGSGGTSSDPNTTVYGENKKENLALRTICNSSRFMAYGISKSGSLMQYNVSTGAAGIGFGFCLR